MKISSNLRFILIPALLSVLFIIYSCNENTTTPSNTTLISGILTDEQDIPVPGAIIQVFTNSSGIQGLIDKDTSDEDGFFLLSGLPDNFDGLKMRVEHQDFESIEIDVKKIIQGKDKKNLEVKMQHDTICTGFVELTVLDKNENPLQNVVVKLNRDGKLIRKAKSNKEGYLKFEHVCPGSYWFRLAKDGFKVIEEDFKIESNDSLSFPFTMNKVNSEDTCCNGIIYFNVKDSSDKQALKDVKVRLWKGKDKISEKKTDEDGNTVFENICEGEYQISFFKDGYKGQEFNFNVACDDTLEFSKLMLKENKEDSCCNGIVYIIVKDSVTKKAIPYVKTKLWKNGKIIEDGKTNDKGTVIFDNLCEGKYSISLYYDSYKNIEFNFELGCNDTLELHKSMFKESQEDSCCNGVIYFIVKDSSDNKPISKAKVRLWKGSKKISEQYSNSDGLTLFKNICEGKYQISFTKDGYKGQEFNFEVGCNDTLEIHKKMLKESNDSCNTAILWIGVKDKETHNPIYGADVIIKDKEGNIIAEGKTNESGVFEKKNLKAPFKYFVYVSYKDYKNAIEDIYFEKCIKKQLVFKLEKKE